MTDEATARIAKGTSWKTVPLGPMASIPYVASFSSAQSQVLRRGLVPAQMEDKWFIFWEGDSLFFHRSWTGDGIYEVTFRPSADGVEVSRAAVAKAYRHGSDREEAALVDFLIRGLLLRERVAFPVPAALGDTAGLYQHGVAGTGFPERVVEEEKRIGLLPTLMRWLRR